jgi:hypothetical protein
MKRTLLLLLTAALLVSLGTGCGGDKEKGINRNKDRPKAADRSE